MNACHMMDTAIMAGAKIWMIVMAWPRQETSPTSPEKPRPKATM